MDSRTWKNFSPNTGHITHTSSQQESSLPKQLLRTLCSKTNVSFSSVGVTPLHSILAPYKRNY
jgi:hypothetical protein